MPLVIFFPKKSGYGYGGKIGPENSVLYREEKACLGFKYETYGDRFNTYRMCLDCGRTFFCAGIPLGKTCYEWVVDGTLDFSSEKPVKCRPELIKPALRLKSQVELIEE